MTAPSPASPKPASTLRRVYAMPSSSCYPDDSPRRCIILGPLLSLRSNLLRGDPALISDGSFARQMKSSARHCAATAGALAAFLVRRPASTTHSWPSRRHIRVAAGRPETRTRQDSRTLHPGVRGSALLEYDDESSSPNVAEWQPRPWLRSHCPAVTRRRRDIVRPRR